MSGAPEDGATVWQVPRENMLTWRIWGDEFLIYNTASGQTHHLNFLAGEALRSLEAEPVDERIGPPSGGPIRDREQPAIADDRQPDPRVRQAGADRAIDVVKIGDLTRDQLHQRFAGPGLRIRIGPFVCRLHTPIPQFVADFSVAYADFPLCDENEISDFRIRVMPAFRRWPWREAQAEFEADGASPFLTFPRRLAMPFAEWGLNWCICGHAHQFLIFHSAVVEKAGRAAILAGPPGSGKSTLCAALLGRGWRLLSVEMALLDPASGRLLPIPRPVALKGASIGLIEGLVPRLQIGRVFDSTHKGTLARVTYQPLAQAEPALPGCVVFPTHAERRNQTPRHYARPPHSCASKIEPMARLVALHSTLSR
jgi:HprK-related kinase A